MRWPWGMTDAHRVWADVPCVIPEAEHATLRPHSPQADESIAREHVRLDPTRWVRRRLISFKHGTRTSRICEHGLEMQMDNDSGT